jgi:hypothetical protein
MSFKVMLLIHHIKAIEELPAYPHKGTAHSKPAKKPLNSSSCGNEKYFA